MKNSSQSELQELDAALIRPKAGFAKVVDAVLVRMVWYLIGSGLAFFFAWVCTSIWVNLRSGNARAGWLLGYGGLAPVLVVMGLIVLVWTTFLVMAIRAVTKWEVGLVPAVGLLLGILAATG